MRIETIWRKVRDDVLKSKADGLTSTRGVYIVTFNPKLTPQHMLPGLFMTRVACNISVQSSRAAVFIDCSNFGDTISEVYPLEEDDTMSVVLCEDRAHAIKVMAVSMAILECATRRSRRADRMG